MSGTPWAIFGLPPDAGVADVRRAYARLLRTHRPDEDAAAFQRLHEAYEYALGQARWREENPEYDDSDGDGDDIDDVDADARDGHVVHDDAAGQLADILGIGRDQVRVQFVDADGDDRAADAPDARDARDVPHATDAPGVPDPRDSFDDFDVADFLAELADRLAGDSAGGVAAWLDAHPGLWSVDRKRALRRDVALALGDADAIRDPRAIDATLAFFGMDSVSRDDAWLLEHVESARRRHEDGDRFTRRVDMLRSRRASWTDRRLFDEVSRPLAGWRRLLVMACPGLPTRASALAAELQSLDPASAAGTLRAAAVDFWRRAADRAALYPPRLAVAAFRLLLFALATGGYAAMIDAEGKGPALWTLAMAGIGAAAWAVWVLPATGFQWLRAWNARHQRWDTATLMTGVTALAAALVVPWLPLMGGFLFFGALLTWLGARGRAAHGNDRSKWATLVAFATAVGTVVGTVVIVGGDALPERWVWSLAGPYAFGVLMLHDVVLARRRRMLLARAHTETGWLWWVALVHGLTLAGLIAIGANA